MTCTCRVDEKQVLLSVTCFKGAGSFGGLGQVILKSFKGILISPVGHIQDERVCRRIGGRVANARVENSESVMTLLRVKQTHCFTKPTPLTLRPDLRKSSLGTWDGNRPRSLPPWSGPSRKGSNWITQKYGPRWKVGRMNVPGDGKCHERNSDKAFAWEFTGHRQISS